MQRVKSLGVLPGGFTEYEPPAVPESIWSVLADCIVVARMAGIEVVTVEETYRGCRTKITLPVPAQPPVKQTGNSFTNGPAK